MGPIIGIGLGIGVHDFELIKRCLRNLVMAAGFPVLASTHLFHDFACQRGALHRLLRTKQTQ